jgi:hypothetical protein
LANTHDAVPYAWPARGAGVVLVFGGAPTEMVWKTVAEPNTVVHFVGAFVLVGQGKSVLVENPGVKADNSFKIRQVACAWRVPQPNFSQHVLMGFRTGAG